MNDEELSGRVLYETSDLWLAAFLLTKGATFSAIRSKRKEKKKSFCLSCPTNVGECVNDYYSRRAKVDPRDLKGRISDLRDILRVKIKEDSDGVVGNKRSRDYNGKGPS